MAIKQNQAQFPADQQRATSGVVVQDVFKIYREVGVETVALRGVSLRVQRGEFVAIMGPSGCGKSTLLNLIGGMDTPSAGQVWIHGRDIAALAEARRAVLRQTHIGFVFQNSNLLPYLTALENVILPMQLVGHPQARQRAQDLLELVNLSHRMRHRLAALSGGEQQRVGIACAIANNPSLLLADEPTGELDTATAKQIMTTLVQIHESQQMAIVLVTHDPDTAAFASRIVTMRDGLIVGSRS